MGPGDCKFCAIIRGEIDAHRVFEDETSIAFLDHRPLFPGHCLIVPRAHIETFADLPASLLAPFFGAAKLAARAVEIGLEAQGSFVAINNRVSQSVPHLHVHVVPRRKKDGLRGFFWPRQAYKSEEEILGVRDVLRAAVARLRAASP